MEREGGEERSGEGELGDKTKQWIKKHQGQGERRRLCLTLFSLLPSFISPLHSPPPSLKLKEKETDKEEEKKSRTGRGVI